MRTSYRWAAAILGPLVLALVLACADGEPDGADSAPLPQEGTGGIYLALGDSIAAGAGASDATNTGYVALVAEALRMRFGETLQVQSLAVASHTTQDLIDQQLPTALERLQEGDVRVVTLTISGNDLQQYAAHPACLQDPTEPTCPLENGLLQVEQRLSFILQELREGGPKAAIVIQAYPNLFSGTGHQFERAADIAFDLLNGVIVPVAERHDVLVADPRRAFFLNGSILTHLQDRTPDAHPNDAGYRAIADAFLEALGLSSGGEGTE